MKAKSLHLFLLGSILVVMAWSLIRPNQYLIWLLEAGPALIGGVILLSTYNKFRLTTLTYVLIWIATVFMMIGAHYTYAEMPLFNWIRDTFGLDRNYYDRLGHFVQGVAAAMIAREILVRKSPITQAQNRWLFFLCVCVCLAVSATYELIEFAVAQIAESFGWTADKFLGLQGDIWDPDWDMLMAVSGAIASLLLFCRMHDRQLGRLPWFE